MRPSSKPVQAPIRLDATPGSVSTAHSQPIELDLAFAMRLWRPSGSKYVSILVIETFAYGDLPRYVSVLYNAEACDLPEAAGDAVINKDETELCDAFDGEGIFLSPLAYDAEVRRYCPFDTHICTFTHRVHVDLDYP